MDKQITHIYEFGPFRIDPIRRVLLRDGQPVPLAARTFDTLLALLEHRGQLVEKEALMDQVWAGAAVEESNLTHHISALRKVLGDSPDEHRYVVTVPGRGYRFVAGVKELLTEEADLVGRHTRSRIVIEEEETNGHTNADCGLRIADSPQAPATIVERLVNRVGTRRLLLAGAILAVGIAGVTFGLRGLPERAAKQPGVVFQKLEISQLTGTGRAEGAAISPDGRYVAYGVWEAGRASLWVRQVGPANSQQIIPPAEARYSDLSFSRDGNYIHYVRTEKSDPVLTLYRIPVLGGVPQKLLANVGENVTLSPDETQVAFTRLDRSRGECALVIANLDGSGERKLAARPLADPYQFPAWSPDGKAIVCATGRADAGGPDMGVIAVRLEDGGERPITPQKWQWVGQKAWLTDGSGLVMVARQVGDANRLWRLSYPGGEAQKITNDSNSYLSVSTAADSNVLVAVHAHLTSDIWIAPEGDAARARRLAAAYDGLAWTPDGRIVYASSASGNPDIWIMNADGTGQKQLTANAGQNIGVAVSPDGRYIAFMSDRNSRAWHIWRMEMDGSNPVQLTNGGGEQTPVFTPDGRWVLYTSVGDWTQWKAPVEGGDPARVTDRYSPYAAVSPDGKRMAYFDREGESNYPQYKIMVIPFAGRQPVKALHIPHKVLPSRHLRWRPDGQALCYAADGDGVSNIWAQPLDGGPLRQLTHFTADRIFNFEWSPDGKQLACTRGAYTHDVVLISNFR